MNELQEGIYRAIDTLTDIKLAKLQFDKTIKAKVYTIANLDTGEYKVKYTGGIFSAYASDLNKQYKVREDVYVKIPEGDFSNKKFIEGRVSNIQLTTAQVENLSNTWVNVSPTMKELYGNSYPDGSFGVIAGAPLGSPSQAVEIYKWDEPNVLFSKYAEDYGYLKIKASFKTTLQSTHTKGNYGIEVVFYAGDEGEVSYRLDLGSFNGAPYNFTVYSPQEVILAVQKNYLKGLKRITLFEEDFEGYDRRIIAGVPAEINDSVSNIFVQDIEIAFVEQRNMVQETMFLNISTKKGTILSSAMDEVILEGQVIALGENIYNDSTCSCQWYIQDWSIYPGTEGYNKQAGFGWRKLEGETSNELVLKKKDVLYKNRYKLIVIYNERTPLMAEVEVVNADSDYDLRLAQLTEDEDIVLKIENLKNNETYCGDWYLSYPDVSYSLITKAKSSISATQYLKYSKIVFYCQVIKDDIIIANLSHQMLASEAPADVDVSFGGESTYRYDAAGKVTIEDYEQARYLTPKITWKDNIGNNAKIEYLGPDGKVLSSQASAYNPSNSMMENIRLDSFGNIVYNIKRKYEIINNRNSFFIRITTIDGQVYSFEKEIIFLKDGDQGTNGSDYVIVIRPCDNDGVKLGGYHPLVYNNNAWQGSQLYRCYVYRDDKEISDDDDTYKVTFSWGAKNLHKLSGEKTKILAAAGQKTDGSSKFATDIEHYLSCEVVVTDLKADKTEDINTKTTLYAFYPVDVVVGSIDNSLLTLDNLPSYIKYTASGVQPDVPNSYFEIEYNDIPYTSKVTSLTPEILTIIDRTTEEGITLRRPKPAPKFIGDNTNSDMGVFKLPLVDSNYIIHTIIMFLDTFGNEAINGWNGRKLEIDPNGKYIFAPQIGAGEKNDYNQFSGVLLGKGDYDPERRGNKWGVYGFKNGQNAYGLTEDGRAWFGSTDQGRIIVDGDTTTIKGGNGGNDVNGMTITLAARNGSDDAIRIGGGKFVVDYNGNLKATGISVSGVTTGTIYANYGSIAGWTISGSKLQNTDGSVYLDGKPTGDEKIYFKTKGWKITEEVIASNNNKTIMDVNGEITTEFFKIKLGDKAYGTIGAFTGNQDGASTDLTGIRTAEDLKVGIALEAGYNSNSSAFSENIRLSAKGIYLDTRSSNDGVAINAGAIRFYGARGTVNINSDGANALILQLEDDITVQGGKIYAYFSD